MTKYNYKNKSYAHTETNKPFYFIENNKESYFCGYISFNFYQLTEPINKNINKKLNFPLFSFLEFKKADLLKENKFNKIKKEKKEYLTITPNSKRENFIENIKKLKKHIENGDIYVINFSEKFTVNNFAVYDLKSFFNFLYKKHPFPYSIYFEFENPEKFFLLSHSPECFIKKKGDKITTCPIKGSANRDKNLNEDLQNMENLLRSEKEISELSMVVDLERNDLSKICIPGSVKVDIHRKVEAFKTIYHTYSRISGILKDNITFKDIIYATFPGGSITGSPKPKSIELIEKYEKHSREIYTGIAGVIFPNRDFIFNICIRTGIFHNEKIDYYSGAGIVYKSDPQKEYEEIILKTKSFFEPFKEYYGYKEILFESKR